MACVRCKTVTLELVQRYFLKDDEMLEEFKVHGVLPSKVTSFTLGNAGSFKASNSSYYCKRMTKDKKSRKRMCSFNALENKDTF